MGNARHLVQSGQAIGERLGTSAHVCGVVITGGGRGMHAGVCAARVRRVVEVRVPVRSRAG